MGYRFGIFLLSIGFFIRLTVVLLSPTLLLGDEISFDVYGWSIAQGHGMVQADGTPTSLRPPLYPLFLGMVYFLFGHSILAVKIIQAILGTVTILLSYQVARFFVPKRVALITAFFFCFYLPNIMAPTRLYAEVLFLFWLTLSFWGVALFWKKPKASWALLTGAGLGLATLTRAAGLPLLVLVALAIFYRMVSSNQKKFLAILFSLVFIIGFFTPILPWSYRNVKVHQEWVLLTTEPGHTLYYSYFPKKGKIYGLVEETELSRKAATIDNEYEQGEFLKQRVIQAVVSHPKKFILEQLPLKIAYFWSPFYYELFGNGTYDGTYVFLIPFWIIGLWGLSRNWRDQLPIWLLMFYPFLVALIFYGSSRLRYPATPAFLIFAAYGFHYFYERWKDSRLVMGMVGLYGLINVFLIHYSPYVKNLFKRVLQLVGLW